MATSADAATAWGVIERRVRKLCENGQVPGAVKGRREWFLPAEVVEAERVRRLTVMGAEFRGSREPFSDENPATQNKVSDSQEAAEN
jgi:hypothetical protein